MRQRSECIDAEVSMVSGLDAVVHERAALELVVVLANAVGDLQLPLVDVRPHVVEPAHVPQLLVRPARSKSR
jgi:hypothetical protein